MNGWSDVTRSEPCPICGRTDWCTRNGTVIICRRRGEHPTLGRGVQKTGEDGADYWVFGAQRKSTLPEPTLQPSPKLADADARHNVYSRLLRELSWPIEAQRELSRRGLSPEQIGILRARLSYAWLDRRGRARIASKLIDVFGEATIAGVPGFVVREHNGRRYWTIGGPAGLLMPVRDVQGRIIAAMVRVAGDVTGGKYRYLTSKKRRDGGAGPGSPVHVPLHDGERAVIRVTEGVLKADLATIASGVPTIGLPGVASWRRAGAVLRELGASEVFVAFDADWRTNPVVAKAMESLIYDLGEKGFTVAVEAWDAADGKGIDDLLLSTKMPELVAGSALRELLQQIPTLSQTAANSGAASRTLIEVNPDEHIVIAQALDALRECDTIYHRAGVLVHVVREREDTEEDGIKRSAGTPRIRSVSAAFLRELLASRCYFYRTDSEGNTSHCAPPGFAVQSIHTRGFWPPLRKLAGITETPVLRADGTILDVPGWDESTSLIYDPGDAIPSIPLYPSRADALAALATLVDLVADFPFAGDIHRSAWLAGLLTVLARRAFSGPSPLFLIDANVRGSGKSLLTDLIAIIVTGRGMPRLSNPGDDDEARKRITSLAIAGDPLVLIDNIATTLGSASLDAALTSTLWKDRLLGVNQIVECALRAVWFATGNNVMLLADTSRRVCHVRLESPLEAPEERTGFRHPKLLAYARENRLSLLTAGLTILRAYCLAGRPDAGLKPWGSFEGWSGLVRNAIVWVGFPDPGETRRELAEQSDRDAAALRSLFAGWSEIDPNNRGLTAAELVKKLNDSPSQFEAVRSSLMELCGTAGGKALAARQVGNQLRRFKGRIVGGQRLDYEEGRGRQRFWKVLDVGRHGPAGDTDDTGDTVLRPPTRESDPLIDDWSTECQRETVSPQSPESPMALCQRCEDVLGPEGICLTCASW